MLIGGGGSIVAYAITHIFTAEIQHSPNLTLLILSALTLNPALINQRNLFNRSIIYMRC